jgi:hypothetical protein
MDNLFLVELAVHFCAHGSAHIPSFDLLLHVSWQFLDLIILFLLGFAMLHDRCFFAWG